MHSVHMLVDEKKTLNKLDEMLATVRLGKNVQNRQLRRWLTDEQYEQFEQEWQEQRVIREELKEKPEALKNYERKLKEAIIMNNHSEAYARKGNRAATSKSRARCESLYEDALETLQEVVHAYSDLVRQSARF